MPDLDLEELADEVGSGSIEKRLLLAHAQQTANVAAATERLAAATEACVAELHRLRNPQADIEDDPWEAAEKAQAERAERQRETKAAQSSARRDRARGGGVAAQQKRRERGLSD